MAVNFFRLLHSKKSYQKPYIVGCIIFFLVFLYSAMMRSGEHHEEIQVVQRRVAIQDLHDIEQGSVSKPNEGKDNLPSNYLSWLKEQEVRKKAISEACKDIPNEILFKTILKTKASRKQLLVDDAHRAIYCFIPKVASTNWMKAWMLMSGMAYNVTGITKKKIEEAFESKTLKDVENVEELTYKIKNYKKVIVVRHPLERLLSVYSDDVQNPQFNQAILRNVQKTRPEAKSSNITWPEFVEYIVTDGVIDSRFFLTYEDLCHPCAIDYDVVVKFETAKDDSANFLELVRAPESLTIEDPSADNQKVDAEVFRLHSESLSERQLEALRRKYKRDFTLFQYDS